MCSGGIGSWFTGHLLAGRGVRPEFLFADTFVEDDDLYRFLIEGSARVLSPESGDWKPLLALCRDIPPLDRMPERKRFLEGLAASAAKAIPGLHWVADGRTPWEVFWDSRFIGNTRAARCSHELKQDVCRRWLEENCDPAGTTLYVGIHWSEMERFAGTEKRRGVRELWKPWRCESPLCERPFLPADAGFGDLQRLGIDPPALYLEGFPHNNCGGFCVKAGQKQFLHLLAKRPATYQHHERQERGMREYLGKDVAILRDRTGGTVKPLPLTVLREKAEANAVCDEGDWGGCGCFSSERNLEDDAGSRER